MTTPAKASPPDTIGRFRVLGVLGRGSQGVVYLAEDPRLDRRVAIKTLRVRHASASELLREARTMAGLRHPNIVPVFEVGDQAGTPYVVYQLIEGRALRQVLAEGPRLPVPRALQWAIALLDALSYAHAQGVIHRDISPGNVLIASDAAPMLTDFGIAAINGSRSTSAEGIWGTVRYLAPELLADGAITPATDVFSLGLLLYEMLSGLPAIGEEDPVAAMYHIAHDPVARIATVQPEFDPVLDGIVQQALVKDPGQRYASAGDLRQALVAYLEAREPAAEPQAADQSTLGFLLRRMRQRSDFPAVSEHISEIAQKTASLERTHAAELSNVILKDYALTTKLLKLVNSSFYSQYGGRISTVSRAVVILGFNQVRMAAMSLLLFDHLHSRAQADALKDLAGRSFFSGVIGRRLAGEIEGLEPEQTFVCAMFHGLGEYLTAYYLPEEYRDIQQAMRNKGQDAEQASQAVLGVSYEALGRGVAREWHLPDEILESMEGLPEGPVPKAKSPRQALHHLAAFASELTEAMATTQAEDRSQTLVALRQRYAKSLPLATRQVEGILEHSLDDMRVYAEVLGVSLRSSPFFQHASQWARGLQPQATPGRAPAVMSNVATGDEPSPTPQNTVLNGIQDISQAILENDPLNDILVMVLETIYRGMGFSRVLLLIRDGRHARMSARFGLGKDIDTLLARFQFSLTNRADPFVQAVHDQTDVVHTMGQRHLDASLPEWYRLVVAPHAFVLFPVVINRLALGLIYADREDPERPLGEAELNYLNTLRNQAALAIKQRS